MGLIFGEIVVFESVVRDLAVEFADRWAADSICSFINFVRASLYFGVRSINTTFISWGDSPTNCFDSSDTTLFI